MSKKNSILIGTFILTATGFLSRIIGFLFRMFLSHTFGEEQVGLYQLIFPIYALCVSFSSAGIETAISRCVARKTSLGRRNEASHIMYVGLVTSLLLSLFTLFILQTHASDFAIYVLGDIRCESMLIAISYALPFTAIHSCVVGYYYGLQQTKIPAVSQLIEQLLRVISVYVLYQIALKSNSQISIIYAVFGIVAGEFFASLFSIHCFSAQKTRSKNKLAFSNIPKLEKELLQLAIPLTSSRILLNVLQSIESVSTPLCLQQYGYTTSEALSNYGVLTGMALPCVLFPTAITNSISTMLLPAVAEIQATKNYSQLKKIIEKVFLSCMLLGFACCIGFFVLSDWMGNILFHSDLAGDYLKTLAWICPFLYLNSTLVSITNGLGKANITLVINSIGLTIRIVGVLVFIPMIGMNGYLWGFLASQIITCLLCFFYLCHYMKKLGT